MLLHEVVYVLLIFIIRGWDKCAVYCFLRLWILYHCKKIVITFMLLSLKHKNIRWWILPLESFWKTSMGKPVCEGHITSKLRLQESSFCCKVIPKDSYGDSHYIFVKFWAHAASKFMQFFWWQLAHEATT